MRVKGGGHTSQIYAIRQAIAKAIVAYYAKYFDAYSALELKKTLVGYDRSLLIADPRRMEPKKFGGQGARARRQKRWVIFACTCFTFGLFGLPLQLPVKAHYSLHLYFSGSIMLFAYCFYATPTCKNMQTSYVELYAIET